MANNDFQILLGAKVNTAGAQKEIDKIIKDNSKRKIDLNLNIPSTADFKKQLKQIQSELNSVTTNVREYTTAQGQLVTKYEQLDKAGNRITNVITQQTNAYGDLTTKTQVYYKTASEYNARLVSETEKVITKQEALRNAYDKATNSFRNISTETNKYKNNIGELVTRTTSVNEMGQKTQTIIKELTDATGRLTTKTQEYIQVQGRWVKVGNEVVNTMMDETKAIDLVNEQMVLHRLHADASGTAVRGLVGHIADATKKVALFAASTAIIGAFTAAVGQAVTTVKEFDSALTEFKKVSDLNGQALDNYTKKLGELGSAVARTRAEMVESATVFRRSGFSDEDAARLAQIAELYRNIADVEISSEDSAMFIISQLKAFDNLTESAESAEHAISALNNVSNNMAVSSADLATGLSKTASAMATAGNTYEQSLALLTASSEIMQGQASKASRGLKLCS